ncbi:MBL fold metallo-hydrolase [Filimonas effusa]|uniref:MBL fold metallo-hydrolase n=1 Tax=Filimonas effusa TaxID=2508721 RepID=A0A4Q1D562_9BACT|nr:MBL fold metallo-hydrolase [Filimonas effusa]RXK83488.1 MBL fold metallo-hydrolase [Filimonas effusa]
MIKVDAFTLNPFQENTYVLSNEKGEALIIDPGCYFSAEQDTIKSFIDESGLRPVQLLNTHCHLDHVFGNKWAAATWNLELYIHPEEEKMLKMAPESGARYGLTFDNYVGPVHFIAPGQEIVLGDDRLEILLAPGHSPGSLCFYSREQGFLIGGDVLFHESIGRSDLPFGNHEQLINSITTQLWPLPDETVVYPGHGPSTTIGHEKKHNPFL